MAWTESYAVPVYEAVVCGLALKQMERQESHQKRIDLMRTVAECQAKYRGALEAFRRSGDLSEQSRENIVIVRAGLTILVAITRPFTDRLRAELPNVTEPYHSALAAIYDDIDTMAESLREILEAWSIALDDELVHEIKSAAREVASGGTKEEIPDWRDVLASVHD